MMEGLAQVAGLIRTKAAHPLVIAACVAFGFVYIHPFYDGNGRLHRFLIHHLLRQAGVTPEGVVLPVSASMLKNLPVYAGLLKDYSAPRTGLLNYVLDADSDTILIKSPQPYWLYASFDATALCEFVFECIQQCVEEDLALEIRYLKAFDASVARIEGWLDLRQARLTNLIDLVVQNHGELSNRKRAKFTELSDAEIARIEEVVRDEFADYFEATAKAA
ncbi:Fic/DOC family protein [compost metagenome]